jgi:alpha-tubulin suppressor-like RCC1 family protein
MSEGRTVLATLATVFVLVTSGSSDGGTSSTTITAAGNQNCALLNGGVKCWGANNAGQLGDGTRTNRLTAVPVSELSSGVQQVASGGFNDGHTCALLSGGAVKCWGDNTFGQLGDGTETDRTKPIAVSGVSSGVQAIALGDSHTCALLSSGGVKCWGYNGSGELGDGTRDQRDTPTEVAGLSSGVQAITAGSDHTCALTSGGAVKCWGSNGFGQLGDGTTTDRSVPTAVSGLSGVTAIVGGGDDPEFNGHTCALLNDGGIRCWGSNEYGQLGDRTETDRHRPVAVSGLTDHASAITAGSDHTCALSTVGGVECWGNGSFGALGRGNDENSSTPVGVSTLPTGVQGVAAGAGHTCALLEHGGAKCWGYNSDGQVGDGSKSDRRRPVAVLGLASGVQVLAIQIKGQGTVRAGSLRCQKRCGLERARGTRVVLATRPAKRWSFKSWAGACKGGAKRCTLVLNSDAAVTARFTRRKR